MGDMTKKEIGEALKSVGREIPETMIIDVNQYENCGLCPTGRTDHNAEIAKPLALITVVQALAEICLED